MSTTETVHVTARLDPSMREKLLALAKNSHRTFSAELRYAIDKHLKDSHFASPRDRRVR
jgi:predicted DNA-binding protein